MYRHQFAQTILLTREAIVIFSLLLLNRKINAAPIEFESIWFQHTNQIVDIYERLSGLKQNQTIDSKLEWIESAQCHSSMKRLVHDAKDGQFYANKMIDSIGRPTSGILEGRLTYLGQYDECIASSGPVFSGKYCIAQIQLPHNFSNILSNISGIASSLYQNLPVKLGVCVPSTCSTEDVSLIAQRFSHMFNPTMSVRVVECIEGGESKTTAAWDSIALIIFVCVCMLICVLVFVGTTFEYLNSAYKCSQSHLFLNSPKNQKIKLNYATEGQSLKRQLILCFSIRENLRKIFDIDDSTEDRIGVFHGIKFFAMIWIIFSHSISFSSQWINFNNPLDIRRTSHNLFSQVILNGTFSVDCFFFISGYLVTYCLWKHLQRTENKLKLGLFYLKRYLRMTPTMMVMIGFGATLLRFFGNGPEWTNSTIMFDGWCRHNWWINSLYLHNFINIDNMCLSHSWYSAVDTQFYIISPLLVILLRKRPTIGVSVCLLVLTSSVVTTWMLTILNNYPAVPYFNDLVPLETLNSYYQNIYIKPYCRIGPYIVGMLLAFSMFQIDRNVKLSHSKLFAGWTFTVIATLGVIVVMLPANQGHIPDVHLAAAYSATARILWALGLAWVTFVSQHGHGSIVNSFLSLKVWMPFSRLTYCAYLVHPILIAIFYGSRHQTFDYSFYLIFYFSLSNICITYMVSLFIALFVEYPIASIGQVLLRKHQ